MKLSPPALKAIGLGIRLMPSKMNYQKRFCAIKNDQLFWYKNENSTKSQNSIYLKEIVNIELHPTEETVFILILKGKERKYQLKAESKLMKERWIESLEKHRKLADESLNSDSDKKYGDNTNFNNVTDKSCFVEYSTIYEKVQERIREEEQKRQREEFEKNELNQRLKKSKSVFKQLENPALPLKKAESEMIMPNTSSTSPSKKNEAEPSQEKIIEKFEVDPPLQRNEPQRGFVQGCFPCFFGSNN